MRLFIWRQIGLFRIFFASHKDEETASNWSDQRKKRCELGSVTGQAGFMSWEHFPEYSWGVKSTDNFTDLTWEGTMVIVWFSVQGMESHVTPPALCSRGSFQGDVCRSLGPTRVAEKGTLTHPSQQTTQVTLTEKPLYLHWESFSCP